MFDDHAKDGVTPTYSWTKMKMSSPMPGWGNYSGIRSCIRKSDPIAIVSGGTLYIGAIMYRGSFDVCAMYRMDRGKWEEVDIYTDTEYELYDSAPPSVIELDGVIYVIGGHDWNGRRSSVNKYDLGSDAWEECCEVLKERVAKCSLVLMDKKVLILDIESYEEELANNAIIQMYDPAEDYSLIVLEAAALEKHDLKSTDLRLIVQSGVCYMICDPERENAASDDREQSNDDTSEVEQNPRVFEQNPRVFKLVCNLGKSRSPSVEIGEEIPQTHSHRNNNIRAFCIEDKTFVNVHGCVYKIKDGIANENDLKKWRNITKTSQRPVYFTFDIRNVGGTRDDKDEESESDESD